MPVFDGIIVIFCTFSYRLEGNFLKESFCRPFAEILRKNQRLRELDLFPDYLDDRVIEMLCKGLKHPDCKIEKLG